MFTSVVTVFPGIRSETVLNTGQDEHVAPGLCRPHQGGSRRLSGYSTFAVGNTRFTPDHGSATLISDVVAPVRGPFAPFIDPVAPVRGPFAPGIRPVAPVIDPVAPVIRAFARVIRPVAAVIDPVAPVIRAFAPVRGPVAPVMRPFAPVKLGVDAHVLAIHSIRPRERDEPCASLYKVAQRATQGPREAYGQGQ